MDFIELQKEMGINFDTTSVRSKLHILRFDLDKRKEKVVSGIDGLIVFVNPHYLGEWPTIGECWLCNVTRRDMVYWADPLIRINSALLMGLDERIRNEMFDALWQSNRKDFEKVFEDRYRQAATEKAKEQLEQAHREEVDALRERISELESKVAQDRIIIGSMQDADEIELSSEEESSMEERLVPEESAPPIPHSYRQPAPGVPEMLRSVQFPDDVQEIRYNVTRITPNCLRSPSFTDGKYFVHISPNGKYLLIRPNPHGNALCINKCISVGGLGVLAPGPNKDLVAEYSQKYGGMLVYL